MSKFRTFITHPRIHVALAAGISIIAMAWCSKHILPEPLGKAVQTIPPGLMTMYELFLDKYKDHPAFRTWIWILVILLSTALIIVIHL